MFKINNKNSRKKCFDWDKALRFNDVDKQVAIFSDTLINMLMQNFVANETIICDDRDPSSINKEIKQLIEQNNQFYKRFTRSNKTLFYINQFKALQVELGFLIENSKNNYYSKLSQKLSDKATSSKAYWSIVKTFLNDKKILCIPPVFHDNKFAIDFRQKLNFLIHFLQNNLHYQRIIVSYQKICCFLLKNVQLMSKYQTRT